MTSSRWLRIQEVFYLAADLPLEERRAFLERECSEEEIRLEVESLIATDQTDPHFLGAPLVEELVQGTSIGPYEVLRELGRGGMGTVYLAVSKGEQSSVATGQQVAVKVINRGMNSPFAVSRFAQERQILATLDHPHIARFLDGGVMADGRPYLAMEFIDGLPIDAYCDRHELSLNQRLELFLQVCGAIHHAHRKLYVHRDLKPSNVLVSAEGIAKVLDFGTAKLLDPAHRLGGVASTAMGVSLLTPGYASPEQLRGEPIDTLTDVYGLGLLLYELLSGHRAYQIEEGNPIGWVRAVCETEPAKPSAVVRRHSQSPSAARDEATFVGTGSGIGVPITAPKIVEAKGAQLRRLQRSLEGDLDKIVLMALRKEPNRRYSSVEQMAEDLRRHLLGLPVQANRGTLVYRARRFAQRHPKALTAASVALLSMLLFGGSLLRQIHQTQRQQARAELEREKAEHVSGFLVDLFERVERASPGEAGLSARELLDRGAAKILRISDQPPELRGALLEALGAGYQKMALFEEALPLLEEALRLRTEALGERHLDTATSFYRLAELYLDLSRYEEALHLLEKSLAIRKAELGEEHALVGVSYSMLAFAYLFLGDYDLAQENVLRAIAIQRSELHSQDLALAQSLQTLGNIYRFEKDYDRALANLSEAVEIQERALGPESTVLGEILHDLAVVYQRLSRFEEGKEAFGRSIAITGKALGEGHPTVAMSQHGLGVLLTEMGDLSGGAKLMRQAIRKMEMALGEESNNIAIMIYNLGYAYLQAGDLAEAEPLMLEALGLQEKDLGVDHPFIAFTVNSLGAIARQRGDFERAQSLLTRGLEIRQARLGVDHPSVAISLHELAKLHRDQKEFETAEALLREALEIRQQAPQPDTDLVANTRVDLYRILEKMAKGRNSIRGWVGQAHELRQAALGPYRNNFPFALPHSRY
ncbi:MAG: serine/threonine-protein kinase [Deltaproteobacteria bacterium]|nr:serine/threonine-protein kinase [Deltaproteobacteria bacterium]